MAGKDRILVIQTAFPGDAILTLPFIQELKKQNAESTIDVLCIPSTAEIFSASPVVERTIILDKRGENKGLFGFLKFVRKLKENNYQAVFSPHRSFRSAMVTLQLNADKSYGFDNSSLPFVFKKTLSYDHSAHEVKRNLNLLDKDYSGDKWKIIPEIKVSEESAAKVSSFLNSNKITKFIAVAPGSVWETKKYPLEYFKELVKHFIKLNFQLVMVGGEKDKELCESLLEGYENKTFVTAGNFTFIETIELLKSSSMLICNDSAPTHLGVCADIPVLTIYCSTTPRFGFYPYNSKSDFISYDELFCKPCGIHGFRSCPLNHFNCGKMLLPESVILKAESLLSNAG